MEWRDEHPAALRRGGHHGLRHGPGHHHRRHRPVRGLHAGAGGQLLRGGVQCHGQRVPHIAVRPGGRRLVRPVQRCAHRPGENARVHRDAGHNADLPFGGSVLPADYRVLHLQHDRHAGPLCQLLRLRPTEDRHRSRGGHRAAGGHGHHGVHIHLHKVWQDRLCPGQQ